MSPLNTPITYSSCPAITTLYYQAEMMEIDDVQGPLASFYAAEEEPKVWKISHDCPAPTPSQSLDSSLSTSSTSEMDIGNRTRSGVMSLDACLDEIIAASPKTMGRRRRNAVSHPAETAPNPAKVVSGEMEIDDHDNEVLIDTAVAASGLKVDDFLDEIVGRQPAQASGPSSSSSSSRSKTNSLNNTKPEQKEKRRPDVPIEPISQGISSHPPPPSTPEVSSSASSSLSADMEIDDESMSKELRLELAKRRAMASVRRPKSTAAASKNDLVVRGRPQHKDITQLQYDHRSHCAYTGPRNGVARRNHHNINNNKPGRHIPHSHSRLQQSC